MMIALVSKRTFGYRYGEPKPEPAGYHDDILLREQDETDIGENDWRLPVCLYQLVNSQSSGNCRSADGLSGGI